MFHLLIDCYQEFSTINAHISAVAQLLQAQNVHVETLELQADCFATASLAYTTFVTYNTSATSVIFKVDPAAYTARKYFSLFKSPAEELPGDGRDHLWPASSQRKLAPANVQHFHGPLGILGMKEAEGASVCAVCCVSISLLFTILACILNQHLIP